MAITWQGWRVDASSLLCGHERSSARGCGVGHRSGGGRPAAGRPQVTTSSAVGPAAAAGGGCRVVIHRGGARPAELIAAAEIDAGAVDATSAWAADNLAVVHASLVHARSGAALTASHLHRWHSRLMAHGALSDAIIGWYRRVQNGIGGASPRQAAYVPPPPSTEGR